MVSQHAEISASSRHRRAAPYRDRQPPKRKRESVLTRTCREFVAGRVLTTPDPPIAPGQLVWFRERSQFTRGTVVLVETSDVGGPPLPSDPIRVRLQDGSEVVKAASALLPSDETFGYRCNTQLTFLNPANLIANIESRYEHAMSSAGHEADIYTFTGWVLLCVNPYRPLGIYGRDWMDRFVGRPLSAQPPHPFAIAEHAYNRLIADGTSQSIVITGESGSGKTETSKHALKYLAAVAGTRHGEQSVGDGYAGLERRVFQSNPILEVFGNATTIRNHNSSRFGKLMKLHFTHQGRMLSSTIQTFLLAKSRVVQVPHQERNYHIFYALCQGLPAQLAAEWSIGAAANFAYLASSAPPAPPLFSLATITAAFAELDFAKDVEIGIFRTLAAILHIGNIRFTKADSGYADISDSAGEICDMAARLLGIKADRAKDLRIALTSKSVRDVRRNFDIETAQMLRDALARWLYDAIFRTVLGNVNKHLQSQTSMAETDEESLFIGILDIFGFENLSPISSNGFEQLCINFANERLRTFLLRQLLCNEVQIYSQEHVVAPDIEMPDCHSVIEALRGSSSMGGGVFSVIDEYSWIPTAHGPRRDEMFCRKVNQVLSCLVPEIILPQRIQSESEFTIRHFAGDVTYTAAGFAERNSDLQFPMELSTLLNSASEGFVPETLLQYSVDHEAEGKRIRKAARISVSALFLKQVDALMDLLHNTNSHFIRCLLPNDNQQSCQFDAVRLGQQLVTGGTMEVLSLMARGFPCRLPLDDLFNRYKNLLPSSMAQKMTPFDFASVLMKFLQLPKNEVQFGVSRVFFRFGGLRIMDRLASLGTDEKEDMITSLFTYWMTLRRRRCQACVRASVLIDISLRKKRALTVSEAIAQYWRNRAATTVVSTWRAWRERRKFNRMKSAALSIQRVWRGARARIGVRHKKAVESRAADVLTAFWKTRTCRRAYKQTREAALVVQKNYRCLCARRTLQSMRKVVISLQSASRRRIARCAFKEEMTRTENQQLQGGRYLFLFLFGLQIKTANRRRAGQVIAAACEVHVMRTVTKKVQAAEFIVSVFQRQKFGRSIRLITTACEALHSRKGRRAAAMRIHTVFCEAERAMEKKFIEGLRCLPPLESAESKLSPCRTPSKRVDNTVDNDSGGAYMGQPGQREGNERLPPDNDLMNSLVSFQTPRDCGTALRHPRLSIAVQNDLFKQREEFILSEVEFARNESAEATVAHVALADARTDCSEVEASMNGSEGRARVVAGDETYGRAPQEQINGNETTVEEHTEMSRELPSASHCSAQRRSRSSIDSKDLNDNFVDQQSEIRRLLHLLKEKELQLKHSLQEKTIREQENEELRSALASQRSSVAPERRRSSCGVQVSTPSNVRINTDTSGLYLTSLTNDSRDAEDPSFPPLADVSLLATEGTDAVLPGYYKSSGKRVGKEFTDTINSHGNYPRAGGKSPSIGQGRTSTFGMLMEMFSNPVTPSRFSIGQTPKANDPTMKQLPSGSRLDHESPLLNCSRMTKQEDEENVLMIQNHFDDIAVCDDVQSELLVSPRYPEYCGMPDGGSQATAGSRSQSCFGEDRSVYDAAAERHALYARVSPRRVSPAAFSSSERPSDPRPVPLIPDLPPPYHVSSRPPNIPVGRRRVAASTPNHRPPFEGDPCGVHDSASPPIHPHQSAVPPATYQYSSAQRGGSLRAEEASPISHLSYHRQSSFDGRSSRTVTQPSTGRAPRRSLSVQMGGRPSCRRSHARCTAEETLYGDQSLVQRRPSLNYRTSTGLPVHAYNNGEAHYAMPADAPLPVSSPLPYAPLPPPGRHVLHAGARRRSMSAAGRRSNQYSDAQSQAASPTATLNYRKFSHLREHELALRQAEMGYEAPRMHPAVMGDPPYDGFRISPPQWHHTWMADGSSHRAPHSVYDNPDSPHPCTADTTPIPSAIHRHDRRFPQYSNAVPTNPSYPPYSSAKIAGKQTPSGLPPPSRKMSHGQVAAKNQHDAYQRTSVHGCPMRPPERSSQAGYSHREATPLCSNEAWKHSLTDEALDRGVAHDELKRRLLDDGLKHHSTHDENADPSIAKRSTSRSRTIRGTSALRQPSVSRRRR